jgi:putative addiction module killer protein
VAKLLGLLEIFGYELGLPHAKNLSGGIYELRTKSKGVGYRIYYTFKDEMIVIILVAGDKSSQQRDNEKARNLKEGYEK